MSTDYTNESQQLVMRVMDALALHPLDPQSLKSLMSHTGASRDQVFRAAWNLEAGGYVERAGNDYILSPRITSIAERYRLQIARLAARFLPQQ